MPAGQDLCVAEVFSPGLKRPQELESSRSLKGVDFVVVYESFYRERFTFSTAGDDLRKSADPVSEASHVRKRLQPIKARNLPTRLRGS